MVKVTFNNKKPAQQKTAPVSPEKESAGGVKVTFSAERTRRTKPFSTAANASTQQKDTTVPQTKRGKAASPMFRVQQNDIVPQAQSALAQKMAQGALQKEYAKNYQSMDTFNQHAQDVKAPTVAQRAGNTLKGAAKTYGAGIVNISGMAAQGQGGTAMSPVYREQVETLDQQIAALEATLSDPTMTAQDIADTKEAIANAKAQRDLYQTAVRSGEKTAESVYGVADLVTDSGAEDINKAKSGLGKVGRLAVDVGVAGAQMGADAALGALTGGGALAPMFVRSAGGSAQQARREGATHEQQVNYGFASGVLSVATEKISNVAAPFKKMFGGGFLDNAIGGALAQMNGSAAGKIALSFLAEGGEEVIEDLLQPALQTIYNGKTLGGSYSQLEASEIINDFLVGGILGGLGGGVEAVGSRGGRFYDSHTEIQDITLPTQRRSDADVVNGIADRLFARYDSMIGESGRKAIRGTYQENTDTAQHVKEFIPAYNAGMEGKANPNPTNETAYAGYIAGQNDAKTEARRKTFAQENDGSSGLVYDEYVSREMNSTVADEINTVAKALGVRVRMDDQVLGGKANGVIEGSEIHIAKDANDPVMRVVGHEWTHRVQKLAPEQYTAFRNAIMEDPDVAEAANILYELYNRKGVETSMDEALDEAAANYAGEMIANTDVLNEFIRRHSEDRTLLEKLRDAIREIVGKLTGKAKKQAQTAEGLLQQAFEAAAKNSKNAAGDGGAKRFMFAGENAKNADKEALNTAKEMEKDGADAETIRQKTGWFRGADGKWRSEVNDSGMKLRFESGLYDYETELREKNHAWDKLTDRKLTDEQRRDLADYQRSTERGEADEALYEKLTGEFGGDFEKWALTLETVKEAAKSIPNYTTLGKLVDAPKLFAAYPDLADVGVTFQTLERGQNGGYNRRFDSIELSRDLKNRPEALLDSLTHEVQHAIQSREGFTPGANPEYWNRKLEEGYDGRTAKARREGAQLREQYEQMKADDPEFMRSMEALNAMAPTVPRGKIDLNTWEQVEPDPPEWVRFDERRDQLEEKYGDRVWDYFSLRDSIDRNARDGRMPGQLYRDTAGEIEARDAAARRSLTAEERRGRKPNLGDEDTVFAGGGRSYAIGKTTGNKPFVEVEQDILAGVPEADWVKTVKENLKSKFPNGITVGNNEIQIDGRSRQEMTYSRYMQWLYNNDPQLMADKLRATNNADEILLATTDWINEGLNHPRKDRIVDFARGNVLLRVGGSDYTADVVVGTRKNGSMALYDVLNLQPTSFIEKEADAATSTNPSPGAARNTASVSGSSVSQNGGNVKRYSLKEQRAEDEAYLSLAEDPKRNRGKLQEMVNAAAERAGYDSPDLYHGTRAFGFTEFDLAKMDDGTSIFLTTNPTVAGTYTSADAENTNLETLYRNPKSPADRGNPLKRVDAKSAPLGEVIAAWNREADALGAHKYRAAYHEEVLARAEREIGEEAPRMAAAAKRYAEETDGLSLPVRQYLKRLSDLGNYSGKRLYEEIFILKETESGFEQGTRPDREMNAFVERTGGIPAETAALARAALSDGAFVEYVPNGKNVRSGHPARATEAKFREFYQRQAERENGIYKVRARLQNPLVIDAQGAAWSDVGVYAKELALEKNANLKQLAAQLGLTVEDSGSFLSKKRSLRGPTRSWSQYAKSREYDGVIFKNLYDPGTDVENDANGVSDVYIVFDPAQVKSTEAVTYDDNGRSIPLSERFDAGKRDIRRSLKGTENAQEIAALKRENEMLRQRVGYWKGQTRRSDGVRTDSKSVQQAAKKLVKDYGAEIDSSEIAGDLANLYDYIARGGDETGELTYTEARRRADAIAEKIAENSMAKDEELYQEYSELRKFLRDTRLVLSAEDAASITDYSALRKSLFGKANLGKGARTNVDQVYSELAESYPEFFSETRENNVADQVARIADVANQLYNVSEYNPFEGYMGQAVGSISNDIMERFFDLPQAKKTFADVKAEQLSEARRAGRQAAADAKLAGQMAQGRADAARLRNTQQALEKERSRRVEQLSELRERYREKDATRRESQKSRELRAKITRHASALSQKLLRPSDTKHIPEEMRSSVAAVLNSINQESRYTVDENGKRVYDGSGTPTKRSEAFRTLRDQYQKVMNEGGDMVIDPSLFGSEADGVQGSLEQVIRMGDKRLSELSASELRTMWQVVKAVEHSVSTAGKLLSKSKYETTQQFADAFKSDVRTRRQKLGGNMTISLETPYTFFYHYGQAGKDIYRMLRNAQDQQEVMARDIAEKAQKVIGERAKAANAREWWNSARGSNVWKMNAETHDFSTAGGDKLTLTTAQTMELYLLSKRKQALSHLLGGGVYQPEIRSAETGRTKVQRGTQQVFLTEGDIERITDTLTGEQKRIADGLQELTTGALAKYGNEASMRAYGYRKFTENDYWPIKSAREGLHSTQEKDGGNVRSIKNIGMAQQVQTGANNAVELRSVFDTFADHASDMIDYAAWLAPMEDANRFFNFQWRNDAGKPIMTVKGLLDENGGKGAQQYWQKLMGDIQNGISGKDFEPITGTFARYVGKFKGASVGANIRVVIQQPTAFFRASAVLNPADMAKGLTGGVTKGNGWKKAVEYSPIAMRKDVGSFDIASPYTLKERFYGNEGVTNKLNDLAGAAAGKADAATWGKLWNACEWQVKREKPDVRAGSNEFYSAVNEAFTDMIDQTQVVDGILQRSNIMRGKSALSQQATAFMGEPIMSLNVLMRSYDAFRYEENPAKRSKALKNVGRAATALLVTNVVNALAQSVVDGLRDDDRDKDYWEKFLSAFTGVEGDENNALELIGNVVLNGNIGDNMNPIGQIPFAKDILSLAQGYDVSRPDMEVFADMIKAGQTFIKSIDGSGKKTRKEATLGLIAAASKMFGLPAANIKRDLMATLRTIAQASGSLGFQYEVEKFSYNLANSGNRSRFIGILYDALEQGDYTTYEHIRRDLMEQMGLDGESIQSSLKTRYKKKTESEADYFLPQKSLDLLGIRGKYAYDSGEDEKKFSAADLNAGAYSKYEAQRGEIYRTQADKATSSGAFSRLSDEGKDKALSYADTYAEETALAAIAGGQYEIATKWVREAQEAQQKYRIDPGVFAACRAAASECKTLKDRDGKPIDKSRGMQIMEMLFRSGLNEQQRKAMYEYLGVPENMRHWNRARVDEQLKIARRKAA